MGILIWLISPICGTVLADAQFDLAQRHLAEMWRPHYAERIREHLQNKEISDSAVEEIISVAVNGIVRCQLTSLAIFPEETRSEIVEMLETRPAEYDDGFLEVIRKVPDFELIEATRKAQVAGCANDVWISLELFGYEDYFEF